MDDLVGGFRVQQMAMSSNMLNISRRLGLAEKVAEAEKEEAEERSAEAYRAVNAEASGWGASGSFSASFSYQKQKREIENQETTSVNVVGRSIVYRARMARTAHISKVSDYFENAIIALPTENCEEDSSQDLYVDVLKDFGTHYTTEVVMGAKSVQSMTFQSSDVEKMASEGISAMVAAQLSYSSIGFSAGGGFSAGFSNNEDSRNRVQNTKKERKEYYIGGNPPSGDSSEGSTESLREWARSAAEKPVPIQYKLSSIDELIMPDFFRRLTYGFYERRKCMRQALVRFCQISIAPALCNIQTDEQRGLRRKKRQAEQERTIQNENNFLVLGGAFGFATGAATKPLVLRSQITNYDGLFQIMPVDEQSDKLQTDVHYGEPFVLKTVEVGIRMGMSKQIRTNNE
ncbi:hypothetical protein FSP39_011100 [Pinctada imbricata]|uniref:MACPF domain-containing protein n=1 Tax=Pinctada imbricata TaxID=66713 RepID=A0AA88YC96_PINIB|nr:hypothetical protein FSP39_011100 [Pinctada imbricata]